LSPTFLLPLARGLAHLLQPLLRLVHIFRLNFSLAFATPRTNPSPTRVVAAPLLVSNHSYRFSMLASRKLNQQRKVVPVLNRHEWTVGRKFVKRMRVPTAGWGAFDEIYA
jgi:hypothetical protein